MSEGGRHRGRRERRAIGGRGFGSEGPSESLAPSSGCGAALEARLPALLSLWREEAGKRGAGALRSPRAGIEGAELESAGGALLRLQRGLTGGRELVGSSYMEDSLLLGAYLLYYWPVSYLQTALALALLRRPARRILDLGAGPGPASAAFLDAGAKEFVLVDGSEKALALARGLLEAGEGEEARKKLPPSAERLETLRLDLEAGAALPDGPFDAIVASHSLNELWKNKAERLERRLELLGEGGRRLAPGGFLLILEPALLGTSREALALRDGLLGRGWSIAAPCVWQGPCPALAAGPGRTCHGESAWAPPASVAALAARAGLERASVKATWFAALPPGAQPPAPLAAERPLLSGSEARLGPARVVSEALLNKAGRLRFLLCGEKAYSTLSAPADSAAAWSASFRGLGRYDLVAVSKPEGREGGGFGLGPESGLELLEVAPGP